MLVSSDATPGGIACSHRGLCRNSIFPSGPTIREIEYGWQCTPPFARVAYPEAISSGLIPWEDAPSVNGQYEGDRLLVIPIRFATSATFSGPTWLITCANTAFTEAHV